MHDFPERLQVQEERYKHGPNCEHLALMHASPEGDVHPGLLLEDGDVECSVAEDVQAKRHGIRKLGRNPHMSKVSATDGEYMLTLFLH